MVAVLWFRRDLRLRDHPALEALGDEPAHALFAIDPRLWQSAGPVRRAWLAASLRELDASLDGRLTVRAGAPEQVVPEMVAEIGASSVHVTGDPSPYGRRRDGAVREALGAGVAWRSHGTPYAVDPGTVLTGAGTPYQVFTAFARRWHDLTGPPPGTESRVRWRTATPDPAAVALLDEALGAGAPHPPPGEAAALRRWSEFREQVAAYDERRDRPDLAGTSGLSPYLRLGLIHPRRLLADLAGDASAGAARFRTELAWRDFYADVLWHRPDSAWEDLRPVPGLEYDDPDEPATAAAVDAWREGRTGYPVVDAGMRQLLATGWMHNRVRMIAASFLCKDLHVRWTVGARHFLDHLLDGDVASNNHGWQWVAGTGTDAAPYFRVFNPVTQGTRFDPDGAYVRRWVPELAHLDGRAAHEPWRHPRGHEHGYPARIVDHDEERREALRRYRS